MSQAPHVEMGWFDKLKHTVNVDSISQKLNLSKHTLFDMALFFGIGFVLGFLWKRYANYFIALLLFIGGLIILQQLDLIALKINWLKLQECCGVAPIPADVDHISMAWDWIKLNILLIISCIIGFCLGAKVG